MRRIVQESFEHFTVPPPFNPPQYGYAPIEMPHPLPAAQQFDFQCPPMRMQVWHSTFLCMSKHDQ
jgi:hypothetical protein